MAVTLPSWLQIDPLAPARIKLQANAQRNSAAAQERASQAQAEELQFRREQSAAHQSAQERAAERHDQVLKQTRDDELAQAAQQMQLRRESQAIKTQQFERTLRLKQQAAEQEAKTAAQQMQGLRAVQEGLKSGQPLQKLIAENAPMIFAKHPERIASALPRGITAPSDFTAREIRDEAGNPVGVRAIPGAHGAIKPLPRTTMSPEGMLRADQMRLGVISRQLEEADPSSPEFAKLSQARDAIMSRLEQITSRRGAANPVSSVAPTTPGAAPAPVSGKVRVQSPDGKTGLIPAAQLDEALKSGYKQVGVEPEAAAPHDEAEDEEPSPEDEEE